jgi:hypothetical protein
MRTILMVGSLWLPRTGSSRGGRLPNRGAVKSKPRPVRLRTFGDPRSAGCIRMGIRAMRPHSTLERLFGPQEHHDAYLGAGRRENRAVLAR